MARRFNCYDVFLAGGCLNGVNNYQFTNCTESLNSPTFNNTYHYYLLSEVIMQKKIKANSRLLLQVCTKETLLISEDYTKNDFKATNTT